MNNIVFFMPEETFEKYTNTLPYSEYHKVNIKRTYRMFIAFIRDNGYNVGDDYLAVNKDKLDYIVREFLDSKSSTTYKNLERCCLKNAFYLNNLEFNITTYPVNHYHENINVSEKFLTYDDFLLELNLLFNESEKLICYMAYKNWLGKEVINARMAKMTDVDFDNGTWKLYDGRVIDLNSCDEILIRLLKNTIAQTEYIPYNKKDKASPDGLYMPEAYKYNPDCEYIFKTRNHPRSGNGLAPYRRVGIETMFARLVHEFGEVFNRNTLKVSGFLAAMYEKDPTPTWTIRKINEFKKEVGYKVSSINARVYYMQKYFPELLMNEDE